MTGRQGNPFNGVTLQGRESRELDLVGVISALGVENVMLVNPHDAKAVRGALKTATKEQADDLSVIVFKAPCVLLHRERKPYYYVNGDCRSCGTCTTLGCPAISKDPSSGIASIDAAQCIGCGQCAQYCGFSAIEQIPASSVMGGSR
jgi:indolepyruvate ferredoxin oxidoreductase alpha subunit